MRRLEYSIGAGQGTGQCVEAYTPLAAAAFAAATINPAAAQFLLGNTGNWNTPSVGAPPYTFEARLYGGWSRSAGMCLPILSAAALR